MTTNKPLSALARAKAAEKAARAAHRAADPKRQPKTTSRRRGQAAGALCAAAAMTLGPGPLVVATAAAVLYALTREAGRHADIRPLVQGTWALTAAAVVPDALIRYLDLAPTRARQALLEAAGQFDLATALEATAPNVTDGQAFLRWTLLVLTLTLWTLAHRRHRKPTR